MRTTIRFACVLFAVLVAPICSSCVVHRTATGASSIDEDLVQRIVKGTTSRSDLVELFGPPLIIARYGSNITIPQSSILYYQHWASSPAGVSPGVGSGTVSSETFFELFEVRGREGEYDIWYYESTSGKTTGAFVPFFETQKASILRESLWILVRKEGGIVEDYVFRQDQ